MYICVYRGRGVYRVWGSWFSAWVVVASRFEGAVGNINFACSGGLGFDSADVRLPRMGAF